MTKRERTALCVSFLLIRIAINNYIPLKNRNFIEINGIVSNNNKEYDVEDIVVMSFKIEEKMIFGIE